MCKLRKQLLELRFYLPFSLSNSVDKIIVKAFSHLPTLQPLLLEPPPRINRIFMTSHAALYEVNNQLIMFVLSLSLSCTCRCHSCEGQAIKHFHMDNPITFAQAMILINNNSDKCVHDVPVNIIIQIYTAMKGSG